MTKKARRQAQLVEQIAEHLLAHGLADCGLRRLAEVAGTSDRMLLYYFQSKDALLAAVLKQISSSLAASLVQAFGSRPQPPSEVLLIGDTVHDVAVAEAIGVDCLLIPGGHQDDQRLEASGARRIGCLSDLLPAGEK